jgi:hypothetical protein
MSKSLYERLGGYDGITAVVDNLLPRLAGDTKLGRLFIGHVEATLDAAHCPAPERADVLGFIGSLRGEMVEG